MPKCYKKDFLLGTNLYKKFLRLKFNAVLLLYRCK